MDTEISCLIGKASGTFVRLHGRVWVNPKLTIRIKSAVYLLVFAVLYCTTAKLEPYQLCRWIKLTPSTNDSSVAFSELRSNVRLQTKKCWYVLVLQLCTTLSASAGFADILIWGWVMSESQRLCYTVSWSLANVTLVNQDYVKKRFANET